MPIYEYRCDACGEQMEKLQRMNDDRLVDCPACGKPALVRLVSAAAFRLKGAGWYETDFKKDNKRNLADGGSRNAASGSSGESSAESRSSGSSSSGDSSAGGSSSGGSASSSGGSASSSDSSSGSKSTSSGSSTDGGTKKADTKSATKAPAK